MTLEDKVLKQKQKVCVLSTVMPFVKYIPNKSKGKVFPVSYEYTLGILF